MKTINALQKSISAKKEKAALALLALLVALFYGATLFNGFVLDDRPVIEDNIYIQSLRYLPKVVTGCIWEYTLGGCEGKTLHYRPVQSLSYLLTWQVSSAPWFFHLINLFYFFGIIFLVFALIKTLTGNFRLALFSALIFLAHPINSEPVNWISAVSELSLALFVLLALFFYAQYRKDGSNYKLALTVLFYFVAILSKELAVVILPPIIVAIDFFFFKKSLRELFSLKEFKKYLLFLPPLLVYFAMRQAVLGGFGGLASTKDYLGGYSITERVYYFSWLFFEYPEKLFYPYPLIFLHELREKPDLLGSRFIFLAAFLTVFLMVFYLLSRKRKTLLAFSMLWFAAAIFPLLIFYNIAGENIFAERYLLLPGIGFSMAVAYFLDSLWQARKFPKFMMARSKFLAKRSSRKIFPRTALIILAAAMSVSWFVVFNRNLTWKDNITFLRANLALNPDANSLRDYLADDLRQSGDEEGALQEYEEIVRRDPNWSHIGNIYNALGGYWREKGNLDKAQEYYQKAVDASQNIKHYKSYSNLGAILIEKQDYMRALSPLCKAIQLDPAAPEPQNNFARASGIIDATRQENIVFIYMQMMQGDIFKPAEGSKITFKKTVCLYGECSYIFSPQINQDEILLPFLIMAEAFPNELIEVKKAVYQPDTGEITLNVDQKYQDQLLTFSFPTCENAYYSIQVPPQQAVFKPGENSAASSTELNP